MRSKQKQLPNQRNNLMNLRNIRDDDVILLSATKIDMKGKEDIK